MRQPAKRMQLFSSAVFYELSAQKKRLLEQGKTVVDLGIGSPDLPPPAHLQAALRDALADPAVYGYPRTEGTADFRHSAAEFLQRRYSAVVDPEREVLTLMGAQDALSHLALALIDPGDIVLVPDPGYPIYEVSIHLAGGIPYPLPLRKEQGFLPDFSAIPETILKKAKMLILNYPNNPVTAIATPAFFQSVITFARHHDIFVVHDAAYIELVFEGYQAPSFLAFPGAKDIGIELHSLSKTFNFAGARIALAAGNAEMLSALAVVKSNIDYGVFTAVQTAAAVALRDDRGHIAHIRTQYQERRDALLLPMQKAGWTIPKPLATMFIWAAIPTAEDARSFAKRILEESGVVCVPGVGFGREGEGYVRFALVSPADQLQSAGERIARIL